MRIYIVVLILFCSLYWFPIFQGPFFMGLGARLDLYGRLIFFSDCLQHKKHFAFYRMKNTSLLPKIFNFLYKIMKITKYVNVSDSVTAVATG